VVSALALFVLWLVTVTLVLRAANVLGASTGRRTSRPAVRTPAEPAQEDDVVPLVARPGNAVVRARRGDEDRAAA
jgi:hypothetical protein